VLCPADGNTPLTFVLKTMEAALVLASEALGVQTDGGMTPRPTSSAFDPCHNESVQLQGEAAAVDSTFIPP
jgi:hypothetical protein